MRPVVIPENEMKRGDAILFKYRYVINYCGVDDESSKVGDFVAYSKRGEFEEGVERWFRDRYENELNFVKFKDVQ